MQKASEALHNSSPCHTDATEWRNSKACIWSLSQAQLLHSPPQSGA